MMGRRGARRLGLALLIVLPVACAPEGETVDEARPELVRAAPRTGPADRPAPLARRIEQAVAATPDTLFGRLVSELSESGGFFDTDNLVSNESSYLHVLGALERLGVEGGAYIGVGPDQNFAYIAAIQPEIAFIVDIRRDNVLQHLLFKALFELAETRVEYLGLLHGRALPESPRDWWDASPEELVEYIREARGGIGTVEARVAQEAVAEVVDELGVDLSDDDLRTIREFHSEFIRWGMEHRFSSFGSEPRSYYPTYAELLTETDLEGRPSSFVADREGYLVLRRMQGEGRVIPVVGDFAGDQAIRRVAEEIRNLGLVVSAFYTSNVEFYVWNGPSIGTYLSNLRRLPTDERSVIIRSYFPGVGGRHPDAVDGYVVTQTLQPLRLLQEEGVESRVRSYLDLVTTGTIRLRGSP